MINISIITPNYNHSQFLKKSMGSVVNQTKAPNEYIVIDDGSTDPSHEEIIKQKKYANFIKPFLRKKNIGLIPTLNEGLEKSKSDFILFLASDDFLEPKLVEIYEELIRKNPNIGFICAKSNKVDIDGNLLGTYSIPSAIPSGYISTKKARDLIYQYGPWFYGNTVLLNKKKVLEIGGFNSKLLSYVDGYIYLHLALKHGLIYVNQALSNYRRHENGYSTDTYRNTEKLKKIESEVVRLMKKSKKVFDHNFIYRWQKRWAYLKVNAQIITNQKIPLPFKLFFSCIFYLYYRWFDLFNLTLLDVKAFLRECRRTKIKSKER